MWLFNTALYLSISQALALPGTSWNLFPELPGTNGTEPQDCSGPPGGKHAERWKVGPDRYYAAFGQRAQLGWNNAQDHCMTETDTGAQLAIPHSQDDGHYMKKIWADVQGVGQVWVGKLFESS